MSYEIDAKRGVTNHYGARETTKKYGGEYGTKTSVKTVEWEFTYDDLPGEILSAKFIVDSPWTSTSGTTDLLVGLNDKDGNVIDADGLLTAVNLVDTAIEDAADVGTVVDGTGALVGKSIGAVAGEVVIAPNVADLTAGAGRLIVEYTKA
jgi:hypothetical protein